MTKPCNLDPDLWFSNNAGDRRTAAEACLHCPIQATCLDGATERRETYGVWGGVDFHTRGGRRRSEQIPDDAVKACEWCGVDVHPTRGERTNDWERRRFCSRKCANNRPRRPRKAAA